MIKKYKVAVFNNDKERVLIDWRHLDIDLSEEDCLELDKHLQRYGAYRGEYKDEGEIVIVPATCDLSTEGKYKCVDGAFVPLGFGFGKPKPLKKGLTKEMVFYHIVKSVVNKTDPPAECAEWLEWFEKEIKQRTEELIKSGRVK
jgi:hypothetical protein